MDDQATKHGLDRSPRLQSNPKLLHSLRHILRVGHFSRRTEEAYIYWIRRYARFHSFRHPRELHEADVARFLTHLAVEGRVSTSTQAQALAALLFLYRHVLDRPLCGLGSVPRARAPVRIPVVLSRAEVQSVLGELDGTPKLIGILLYGSGLRLLEALTLRVKDVDLDRGEIRIRRAKGARDRVTVLPDRLRPLLAEHLERVRRQHERDLEEGAGSVTLPDALRRKYPLAAKSLAVDLSGRAEARRFAGWGNPPASFTRERDAAGDERGGTAERHRETSELPHVTSFVRDAPARGRI